MDNNYRQGYETNCISRGTYELGLVNEQLDYAEDVMFIVGTLAR
jgi:hypothetical protein